MTEEIKIEEALQRAIVAHQSGDTTEADRYYTAILNVQPDHADANHNLGILAMELQRSEIALPLFQKAIDANPAFKQFYLTYIQALASIGQIEKANEVVQQARNNDCPDNDVEDLLQFLEKHSSKTKQITPPTDEVENILNLYKKGDLEDVITQSKKLIEKYPNASDVMNICAAAYANSSQLLEAIKLYKQAIEINPNSAEIYNNLGNAYHATGADDDAIKQFCKATELKPNFEEAYNNLGNSLKSQGEFTKAISAFEYAIKLNNVFAEPYNNLGNLYHSQGCLDKAIEHYRAAICIKPELAESYNNLGNCLLEKMDLIGAIEHYEQATKRNPNYAPGFNNLGVALAKLGRFDEAIQYYNKALEIDPEYTSAYNNLGNAYQDYGKIENSVSFYKKALTLNAKYYKAYNNLGNALQSLGNTQEAKTCYEQAISINPKYSEAHRHLSTLIKYSKTTEHFLTLKSLQNEATLTDDDSCNLNFALAKAYEDIRDYSSAFTHLSLGNSQRDKIINYDIEKDNALFRKLKALQPTLTTIDLSRVSENNDLKPIFIVGMPRSGTTLTEQILSSHSLITAAGELNYISRLSLDIIIHKKAITDETIHQFRYSYLSSVNENNINTQFFTDKMPQNFRFIPFILSAFPNAKIIHTLRDDRATCWSNFRHYFRNAGLGYSYNMDKTVEYFKLYRELMDHWRNIYGHNIISLDYEKLVINPKVEIPRLLGKLSLPFEDACLEPQNNNRYVQTASQRQVRRKIYKGSSKSWKNYEKFVTHSFSEL